MATTIDDLYIKSRTFENLMVQQQLENNALITSPAVVQDPRMAQLINGRGRTIDMPRYTSITNQTDNIGSDDTGDVLSGSGLSTQNTRAARMFRTKGFSVADLAGVLAGDNPMATVASQLQGFWATNYQRVLLSILTGVFAGNDANDGGDMTINRHDNVAQGSVTDATRISSDLIIEAMYTLGDASKDFAIIVMHSAVALHLQSIDTTNFQRPSEGRPFATYRGAMVLEDDTMTVDNSGLSPAYSTFLLGAGCIGFGESAAFHIPQEIERRADQGNGAGVETLFTRRNFSLHLIGMDFLGAVLTGDTVSNSELANPLNWDRVAARKELKIARLITNR